MPVQTFSEESKKKRREYNKQWHIQKRSNNSEYQNYRKEYYVNNKEAFKAKVKDCHLKRQFGISWKEYQVMFEMQNGLCVLCERKENNRMLSVDHNHETGEVRGLLCGDCNRGLGLFKDNPKVLLKAAEYV